MPSTVSVSGFEFHAVPAAHETLDRDTAGRHIYLGFVIRAGPHTIYHSGDTVLYPGMADILQSSGSRSPCCRSTDGIRNGAWPGI